VVLVKRYPTVHRLFYDNRIGGSQDIDIFRLNESSGRLNNSFIHCLPLATLPDGSVVSQEYFTP
jgi:hypothetical protein